MIEKLQQVEDRFEQIQQQLCDPQVVSDMSQYQQLMKETKRLQPVTDMFRQYKAALQTQEEARAMLDDPEMRAFAEEELELAKTQAETAWEELKI